MGHVHMGLKKNMCDLCPKGYLNQRNLDHHKTIAHGIGELVKHVCYICGKEVTSKTNLTNKRRFNSQERLLQQSDVMNTAKIAKS